MHNLCSSEAQDLCLFSFGYGCVVDDPAVVRTHVWLACPEHVIAAVRTHGRMGRSGWSRIQGRGQAGLHHLSSQEPIESYSTYTLPWDNINAFMRVVAPWPNYLPLHPTS